MGGKQCGATKHNRARVTKVHKYARRETSPVVVSECECVVEGDKSFYTQQRDHWE